MSVELIADHLSSNLTGKSVLIDAVNNLPNQQAQASSRLFTLLEPLFSHNGQNRVYPVTAIQSEGARPLPDCVYRTVGSTARTYRQSIISNVISFIATIRATTYAQVVQKRDALTTLLGTETAIEVVDANDDYDNDGLTYAFNLEIELASALADVQVTELTHLSQQELVLCNQIKPIISHEYAVILHESTHADLRTLRDAVRALLMGWQPNNPAYSPFNFVSGEPLIADAGLCAWVDVFKTDVNTGVM